MPYELKTETASTAMWQASGWSMVPFNFPVVEVEPPPGTVDLIGVDSEFVTEDLEDLLDAEQAEARYRQHGLTGLLRDRDVRPQTDRF